MSEDLYYPLRVQHYEQLNALSPEERAKFIKYLVDKDFNEMIEKNIVENAVVKNHFFKE